MLLIITVTKGLIRKSKFRRMLYMISKPKISTTTTPVWGWGPAKCQWTRRLEQPCRTSYERIKTRQVVVLIIILINQTKKVSNEFIRKRLRRKATVFGANLPRDIRLLAKDIGTRKCEDVARHKCGHCYHAWLGPVSTPDFGLSHFVQIAVVPVIIRLQRKSSNMCQPF